MTSTYALRETRAAAGLPAGVSAAAGSRAPALAATSVIEAPSAAPADRTAAAAAEGAAALPAAGAAAGRGGRATGSRQVAYHLLTAAGITTAPWQITAFVSCLPVIVLGCAAALAHLIHYPPKGNPLMAGHRRTRRTTTTAGAPQPEDAPDQPARPTVLVVHTARAERIRTTAHHRHAAAQDARERFTVAVDYVRAAEAAAFRAGADHIDELITDGAHDLMALGDELTTTLDNQGRRR